MDKEFKNPAKAVNHLTVLARHAAKNYPWVQTFTLDHKNLTTKANTGRKAECRQPALVLCEV